MLIIRISVLFIILTQALNCKAQSDSTVEALQQIPLKYIYSLDKKVAAYSKQMSSKTEKTLEKLSRWEKKIKTMLQSASPSTAEQLFGNGQPTFTSVLKRMKEGKQAIEAYTAYYNQYKDHLTTDLKYLTEQKGNLNEKIVVPLAATKNKVEMLNRQMDDGEALQAFIKERKKQLIEGAIQHVGKSKYLSKINKEAYYYVETMKNYKQVFNDPAKAEQTVKAILSKVPAFQKFVENNSMLASIFPSPGPMGSIETLGGLQTRASLQNILQRSGLNNGNIQQQVSQSVQQARTEFGRLRDKIINQSTSTGENGMPGFTPNMENTKPFKERLEYGSTIQFAKSNGFMPSMMDIALTLGYRINSKSVAGIGAGYKIGLGDTRGIDFSNQGVNLRSFVDWKLKNQFYVTGGMEMNYLASIPPDNTNLRRRASSSWHKAALAGISKKISIKSKWFKETKVQLLFDFLYNQHIPVSQPLIFRVGYNF